MPDDKDSMIAHSPIARPPHKNRRRIVIREVHNCLGPCYVVETQVFDLVVPYFDKSEYFAKSKRRPEQSLALAWEKFQEQSRALLDLEPADADAKEKAEEIADIAESIINALLPEDEDERVDLLTEEYQLASDIETFESFTGKSIMPVVEKAAD